MYNSHFPIKLGAYSLLRKIWVTTQMIGDGLNETQFIGSGAIDITFMYKPTYRSAHKCTHFIRNFSILRY